MDISAEYMHVEMLSIINFIIVLITLSILIIVLLTFSVVWLLHCLCTCSVSIDYCIIYYCWSLLSNYLFLLQFFFHLISCSSMKVLIKVIEVYSIVI